MISQFAKIEIFQVNGASMLCQSMPTLTSQVQRSMCTKTYVLATNLTVWDTFVMPNENANYVDILGQRLWPDIISIRLKPWNHVLSFFVLVFVNRNNTPYILSVVTVFNYCRWHCFNLCVFYLWHFSGLLLVNFYLNSLFPLVKCSNARAVSR